MEDLRYHIKFQDGDSGEELGLMLVERGGSISFSRNLANPYAAKMGAGDTRDSDLTEWSLISFRDWRGGRGQEELVDPTMFFDATGLDTRIQGQLTLGPLPQQPVGTNPKYEPGGTSGYSIGWPAAEQHTDRPEPGSFRLGQDIITLQRGQRFLVQPGGDGARWVKSIDVRLSRTRATGGVTVTLCSDSSGLPGSTLATKSVDAASIGTTEAWVNFEFASPYQVTPGTSYWIVVTVAISDIYQLYGTRNVSGASYDYGYMAYNDGSWHAWTEYDLNFRVRYEKFSRSMGFIAPAAGMTCTSVQACLKKIGHPGTYTIGVHADNGGEPAATALRSVTFDADTEVGAAFNWLNGAFSSSVTLVSDVSYHVVITPPATETIGAGLEWGGLPAGGYATGVAHRKLASGSWAAITPDMYFRTNTVALDNNIVGFAEYDSKWYVAAGDTVYVWNGTTGEWDVSDQQTNTVTAIEAWGDYLWVGRSDDAVVRRYNGTAWANVPTVYADLLKSGGGYLHRTVAQNLYYTADGTTWSDAIPVGTSARPVTAMEWYRDMIMMATSSRLWGLAADTAYPLLDWSSQADSNNGVGMTAWGKTACLYIPLKYGLYRWNGDTMVAVGPEQGTGLPANRAGTISALLCTGNWMYAAVDAGASGYSSIMAYAGQGWHELQRSERTGQRVLAMGYETLSDPSRLWYGLSDETRYLKLPDYSDNPYQYTGFEFNASGEIEMSWLGGELLDVVKDFHEVVIRGDGLAEGQYVDVYYEIDRSGLWTLLGRVNSGPRQALRFKGNAWASQTLSSGNTNITIKATTSEMSAGDWCKINNEVRQIESITNASTFVLCNALSRIPAVGDTVYAARPAGREIRLKAVLNTTSADSTPRITAVFLRYQNNVLDRYVYQVSVQIADELTDIAGNRIPYTALELRDMLDVWAKRSTSFTLVDPDGVPRTVKVSNAAEGGYEMTEGPVRRYRSTYNITLVEV